jgi:hypothetical protein
MKQVKKRRRKAAASLDDRQQQKVRDKLGEFARLLREMFTDARRRAVTAGGTPEDADIYSPVPPGLTDFVASALEAFLAGKHPSMDAAFGLATKRRGIKPFIKRNREIAFAVLGRRMKKNGNLPSWEACAKAYKIDSHDLRRWCEEYETDFWAEELLRRLGG